MKKTLLFIAMFAITLTGFSQFSGSVQTKHLFNAEMTTRVTTGALAYSTQASAEANFGAALADFTALTYFNAADVVAFDGDYINKISIACNPANFSGSITIKIWSDTTGFGATTAYTQTVALADLTDGWNEIILTTPYALTNADVAFGYTASTTAGLGYKYDNSALAANEKGSYILYDNTWDNIGTGTAGQYLNWNLMANVDDGVIGEDAAITNVTVPNWNCELTATEEITATIKNVSTIALTTAFNIGYKVNNGTEVTLPVTVPIAAGASVDVSFNVDMTADGDYEVLVYSLLSTDVDNDNDSMLAETVNTVANTIPMSVEFDVTTLDFAGWNNEDVNNDGSTWGLINFGENGAHSGDFAMAYMYHGTNNADDYMYSNCIDLAAGDYFLKFWVKVGSEEGTTFPEKLSVKIGEGQNASAMTTVINDFGEVTDVDWTEKAVEFTIATAGTYNLGFYAYSDANMWYVAVDDVTIGLATSVNTISTSTINVYPNPTTGLVHVSTAKDATIYVYNQVGALVKTVSNTNTVDLSDVQNGTYIVKVVTNNNIVVKNIVLAK